MSSRISLRSDNGDEEEIPSQPRGRTSIQEKIAAFEMLDRMEGKTQAEKSMRLKLVGFSNADIAALLQTTPAVVASNIYAERKKAAKKPSPRKGTSRGDDAG